ncbi:hypothetical protein OUZ56_012932 [Daphnia magna]|uniref:Uncharacterized protein n=1 Tax=Daphnia magna TaxID=35525 RepID=A0ABQ9Z5L3_9CRUS|nr:hypothetical protein OUZ56_012932 [Daphnia magna]
MTPGVAPPRSRSRGCGGQKPPATRGYPVVRAGRRMAKDITECGTPAQAYASTTTVVCLARMRSARVKVMLVSQAPVWPPFLPFRTRPESWRSSLVKVHTEKTHLDKVYKNPMFLSGKPLLLHQYSNT